MRYLDHVAYNENLRKRVPTDVLVEKIFEVNDNFAIQNNGLGFSLGKKIMTFCQKNAYNDELVIQYEGPKEEPIPHELDLGDSYPIKFTLLINFSYHKENLLLNKGSMR